VGAATDLLDGAMMRDGLADHVLGMNQRVKAFVRQSLRSAALKS
jgi:hypothetical protein